MQGQQFEIHVMGPVYRARLDADGFFVERGRWRRSAPLDKLRFVFLHDAGSGMQELILSHELEPKSLNAKPRLQVIRIVANQGDAGVEALLSALLEACPQIEDLRGLTKADALAKMGAANLAKVVPIALIPIFTLLVALIGAPMFVHGFDARHDRLTFEELVSDSYPLQTRNLTVDDARLLATMALKETNTRDGETTIKYFVPMVPRAWEAGQPIQVVLETAELTHQALPKPGSAITGVLRDVLWEGLDSAERDFFSEEMALTMDEDVLLIQHEADTQTEVFAAFFATGSVFAAMCFVARVVIRRHG